MRRRKRKREVARVQGYGPGFQAGKRSALALQNFAAEGWLFFVYCTVCPSRDTISPSFSFAHLRSAHLLHVAVAVVTVNTGPPSPP